MHRTDAAHPISFRSRRNLLRRTMPLAVVGLIALGSGSPSSAAVDATWAEAPSAQPSPLVGDWVQDTIDLLRLIYQILGGDPNTIASDPTIGMQQVTDLYWAQGAPEGLTPLQAMAARITVKLAYGHSQTGSNANGPTAIAYRTMLAALYADLGGNPQNL